MSFASAAPPPSPPPPQPAGAVTHQAPEPDATSLAERLTFVAVCTVAGALAGIPMAAAWVRVSDPPAARLTPDGVLFGEAQLDQEVGVTLWFLSLGLLAGLVAGLVVGWLGRRHGVVTVAAVVALCLAGCAVTYLLGVHVFGPDEQQQVASARPGDLITSSVSVTSKVVYLGWPVGGLLGAMGGILGWPKVPPPAWDAPVVH